MNAVRGQLLLVIRETVVLISRPAAHPAGSIIETRSVEVGEVLVMDGSFGKSHVLVNVIHPVHGSCRLRCLVSTSGSTAVPMGDWLPTVEVVP